MMLITLPQNGVFACEILFSVEAAIHSLVGGGASVSSSELWRTSRQLRNTARGIQHRPG
jgi:hypothetical protein